MFAREAWRITDGEWHVDVESDARVPFADAERIVLAIRQRTLVNRLPPVGPIKRDGDLPELDAGTVTAIWTKDSQPGFYDVSFSGLGLTVRVSDAAVELHEWTSVLR